MTQILGLAVTCQLHLTFDSGSANLGNGSTSNVAANATFRIRYMALTGGFHRYHYYHARSSYFTLLQGILTPKAGVIYTSAAGIHNLLSGLHSRL
jgi:hypothetical protein